IEGQSPTAAWPVAAMEAASPVLGKVLRSLPGAKGRIAARDAAGYGQQMGQQSPPLAGAQTAEDLRTLAAGPGQQALGTAKGAANQAIAQGIGARNALSIPSSGPNPMTLQEANDALSAIDVRTFRKNQLDRTF